MAFNLFGFEFKKTKEEKVKEKGDSFIVPTNEDGAATIETNGGTSWGVSTYIDFDGTFRSEFDLVTRYREMSMYPECDMAIDYIVNDAIVMDESNPSVTIDLSKITELDENIKDKIREAFAKIGRLLDWNNTGYEIFRRWYIDGRLFYHVVVDEDKLSQGILELRYIDPRQIRKVRLVERDVDPQTNVEVVRVIDEHYIYNQKGIQYTGGPAALGVSSGTAMSYDASGFQGVRITADAILHCHSGLSDKFSSLIVSHLHKGIKALNQLKMMEDAVVIYRIARAPERRIFYIDVGNLPKQKADDYLRSVMQQYKNKMVYDVSTGETRDDRRFQSMLEDFFVARREGSQSASIETLPGGENLGKIEDVEYFQKKLFRALNVPITRINPENGFSLGKSTEITRDEVNFSKFIIRLRKKFEQLFQKLLQKQLVLTKILTEEEYDEIKDKIVYRFANDNYFAELKDSEIIAERLKQLNSIDPDVNGYIRNYYSREWIRTNVLRQSKEDQELMRKQIDEEIASGETPEMDMETMAVSGEASVSKAPGKSPEVKKQKKIENRVKNREEP